MKIFDYIGSNFFVLVLNTATLIALSATLSLSSFALIAVFQAVLFIAIPLQSFQSAPLNSTLVAKGQYSVEFRASQQVVSLATFLLLIAISVLVWVLSLIDTDFFLVFGAAIFVGLFRSLYTFHDNYLVQSGHSAQYRNWRILSALSVFFFSVVFACLWDSGWARVLGVLIGELPIFFARYPKMIVNFRYKKFVEVSRIVRFGAPLLPVALLSWVNFQSDRYVLSTYFDEDLAGFYAIVFWSLAILTSFFTSLKSIYIPDFRLFLVERYRFIDAVWNVKAYLLLSVLVSALSVVLIYSLLPMFVDYQADGFLLKLSLLVFGLMFFNLGVFGTTVVEMSERSIFRFWVVLASAAAHAPFLGLAILYGAPEFLFYGYFLGFFVQFVGFMIVGQSLSAAEPVK